MEFYSTELLEKYGAFAMEKQLFFADIVGTKNWNVDINNGEISFDNDLIFPIQILGTFSHSSETWLWGWANSGSNLPEKLLEQSHNLKEYGKSQKIDFYTNSECEIERNDMHYIGLVAVGMFGASGYYLGNYGAGTMCLTISAKEIDKKFPNEHHSIFTVFPQLISQYEINHKDAFVNYLNQKNYKVQIDGNEVIGKNGEKEVKAEFDDLRRLTKLNG